MSTPAEKGMAAGYNVQRVMFDGTTMRESILDKVKTIKSRDLRADDILLCTFPKAGTHWVWEILNMIVAGRAEYAKHWQNYSWLEYRTEEELEELESPRILHTHLLPRMLPESMWRKRNKIVYVQRNPKDSVVSMYCQDCNQIWSDGYEETKTHVFTGTWDDFLNIYLEGGVCFGSWFDHSLAWESTSDSHPGTQICKVVYEDLKKDCAKEIKIMAEYLERPLPDNIYSEIAEACSFHKLKHVSENDKDQTFHIRWKEGTSGYFRKGVVGDWKKWFTVAQNERFDRMFEKKLGRKYAY